MVHGPWVDLLQLTLLYKNKGGQPFMTHDTFALRDHKMQILYYFITKFDPKHGRLAPKLSLGNLIPNKPPTQTSRLTLKSLGRCGDICMKTFQFDSYDRNLSCALCNRLLRVFDHLLDHCS